MSTVVDALAGLTFGEQIPEGELVSDAIVITRLVNAETGRESFHVAASDNITTLMTLGLMDAAHTVIRRGEWSRADDDD